MSETTKFHPALAITNVKSLISITLDMESGQYHSWAALFKVQARIHDVLEQIIPSTEAEEKEAYEKSKAADLPLWNRLDVVVLQWIYATISQDVLNSILIDDDSTEHAWQSIADLFHDNKHSRLCISTMSSPPRDLTISRPLMPIVIVSSVWPIN